MMIPRVMGNSALMEIPYPRGGRTPRVGKWGKVGYKKKAIISSSL